MMTAKKTGTVWAQCLSASEISHLVLLENGIDYWILSYREQDVNS